jgi:hypothetical protein
VTWLRISREWGVRLGGGIVLAAIGFAVAVLLDFEPQVGAYVVMALLVLSVTWVVLDTLNAAPAQWSPGLPVRGDRIDEASADLRILSAHQQANHPSDALRDRLVALARGRDPAQAEFLHAELTPVHRLKPAEIDHILTEIEESRDHS